MLSSAAAYKHSFTVECLHHHYSVYGHVWSCTCMMVPKNKNKNNGVGLGTKLLCEAEAAKEMEMM